MPTRSPYKSLSVFSLVMINVIAVDNLRSLPASAEYGLSLIFYYLLGAFLFMIPTALISAELATGWPSTGGMYIWVREAFGKRAALTSIWLLWIYNVVWFPTILAFLAAILAYLINPQLANHKIFVMYVVLIFFWLATFINSINMKISSLMSTIAALVGTILPMIFISLLGFSWLITGHTSQIEFSIKNFLPNLSNIDNLSYLTAVIFGLIGLEMSAVHAGEVKNPQRDYPRALLYSTLIILLSFILSALAIAVVVPKSQLSLVSGLIDAFNIFFHTFHIAWMTPVIACMIILGSLGGISAWVLGPIKGLLVASEDGLIPVFFQKTNRNNMPINMLFVQAILVSLLSLVFIFMPSVSSSFWLLSVLASQLALIYYLFIFAAAIKLRYSHGHVKRAYQIPGGKIGIWLIALIGMATSIAVFFFGFLPPPGVNIGNIYFFEGFLTLGTLFFVCIPVFMKTSYKK